MSSIDPPPPKAQAAPSPPSLSDQITEALADAKRHAEQGAALLAPHREAWSAAYYGGGRGFQTSPAGNKLFYAISGHAELESAVRALDYALEPTI